jgi:hypothetical protein
MIDSELKKGKGEVPVGLRFNALTKCLLAEILRCLVKVADTYWLRPDHR